MTSRYTRAGKQVMQDGKHLADCADDVAAMMVLNALRALEERFEFDVIKETPMRRGETREIIHWGVGHKPRHIRHRIMDEIACSCGLRWDVGEDDPHTEAG